MEYLKGELLIINGDSYISTVNKDNSIRIEKSFKAKAPFFVYTNANKFKEYALPGNIRTLLQFETYLDEITKNSKRPFVFRLTGTFSEVSFHIVNLPEGTDVKSPQDAHKEQQTYNRKKIEGEIARFFSTEHKAIFTHHDTYIHMHFINSEHTEMGHLDDVKLDGTIVRLWIENE